MYHLLQRPCHLTLVRKSLKTYSLKEYIKNNLTYLCFFSRLIMQNESDKDVPNLIGDM